MRWECIHCGSCCGNVFSRSWIDVILVDFVGEPVNGYCPHYDHIRKRCSIHVKRPNVCRGYPFIIKKREDHYAIQVHRYCRGIGSGPSIDRRKIAEDLVAYCEEDLDIEFMIRWEGDELKLYRIK
ncbi:MAG: YkgJ family cysteine cluster protein [Thermoplasmatota archaeon]